MLEIEARSLEGVISVKPMLYFTAMDKIKSVSITYEEVATALDAIDSGHKYPDDIVILTFGSVKFEFPPGEQAEAIFRTLRWFKDAIEAAGPII